MVWSNFILKTFILIFAIFIAGYLTVADAIFIQYELAIGLTIGLMAGYTIRTIDHLSEEDWE